MNFAALDLNLLKVLDALLTEGSTVRASARIGLSQPAVSAALGRLRVALDDPLFVRRGQGMEPTDYARNLAPALREHLDAIAALLSAPEAFDPARSTARFMLSGSDFFAEMLMPDLAARIADEAPGMVVQLVDLVPQNYIATLDRREVDIALLPDQAFPDWIDHAPLFHSPFRVIARHDHPRTRDLEPGARMPLSLFCELGHVLFSVEGKLAGMGDAALARVGRKRRVAMTLPVFAGVHRAVAGSDLIALVPEQHARAVAGRMELSIFEAPIDMPEVLIVQAWHRRATRTPAHGWLRRAISDILTPLNAGFSPIERVEGFA